MNRNDRIRLQRNHVLLVNNLTAEDVCDALYEGDVIDDEELEEITELPKTSKGRVRTLISILKKKTDDYVLSKFCDVLRKCEVDYSFIADGIEKCDISDVGPEAADTDEVDSPEQGAKQALLLKTIMEQSNALLEINRQFQQQITELKQAQESQIDLLKKHGLYDKGVLEFANMFVFNKPLDEAEGVSRPVSNIGASGTGRNVSVPFVSDNIVCKISIDLLRYVNMSQAGRQPLEPFSSHAAEMRKRYQLFVAQYPDVLQALQSLDELHILEINGYQTFRAIADELFLDGCNWGRIFSWFVSCAYLARGFNCSDEALDLYGTYIWFVVDRHQSSWLAENGGWDEFLQFLVPTFMHSFMQYVRSVIFHLFTQWPALGQ